MDIIFSTKNTTDYKSPEEIILNLKSTSFENIMLDLNLFCPSCIYGENISSGLFFKYVDEISKDPTCIQGLFKNIFLKVKDNGLKVPIIYSASVCKNVELTYRLTLESIRICHDNGVKYLIIPSEMANYKYALNIGKTAHENSVSLLFSNEYKEYNGHYMRGFGADGKEFADMIKEINREMGANVFGICVDIGVCNLCGQHIYEYIMTVKECLKGIILTDGDGHNDINLLPFSCSIKGTSQTEYIEIVRALREIMFDGLLIISMGDTYRAFPPMLRADLLELARKTTEYFKWQIEIEKALRKYPKRVLFAAGNTCRIYMKCYGKKYPPLFTCDNNKNMWGKDFCGLKVKDPEELKKLPEDCAIFICSIYYNEIKNQLRNMGLKNPIEYFN